MSLKGALRSPFPRKGDAASVRRQSRQRLRSRSPTTSLRTGDAARGGWIGVFFRGACPRKMISIQFALRVNFQGAAPPGYPRPWVPPPGGSTAPIHSYLFCQQGIDLLSCPICAPHFFFSLQEKKKRAAPGAKEKEGLGCRLRWTRASTRWPCAMWQVWQKSGANQNAPPFSFRCRSHGACGSSARPCKQRVSGSGRRR